jgi:membrane associated rhomboid family serine protease
VTTPQPPVSWVPRRQQGAEPAARTEPPFDPTSWHGALAVMLGIGALLWLVQLLNAVNDYSINRAVGLRPREVSGLWGVLASPFLHHSYYHLFSNTVPLVLIGWVLLLSGVRAWLTVTAIVVVVGGLASWGLAPDGVVVGASALVLGWLGYLLSRAYFSRSVKWIVVAVLVLFFFGTLLGTLLPGLGHGESWIVHACYFGAGLLAGAILHPRARRGRGAPAAPTGAGPAAPPVS